jgi:sterol desaturase/sphingolipid hydroxylase (fatty acid hydroxylase superfamily)
MGELPDVILWSIPAFLLLLVVEWVSYRFHPDDDEVGYDPRDTATSLAMGIGSIGFDLLWKIPLVALYVALWELTPLRVELTWWTLPLVLLGQDFLYYWSHRCHHIVRVLWASHVVHHSSRRFNLSTALRQPWTGFSSGLFYLPLIVCGVPPYLLAFAQSLNLLYQFWIHTERIDRLPRWFEAVLNTPSHHRVHHASNGSYLDRNFGGILIVWDRLFGSFEDERDRCIYGLTTNIDTYNPLRVALHEYGAIWRDVVRARGVLRRAAFVFASPGWAYENAADNAASGGSDGLADAGPPAGADPQQQPGEPDQDEQRERRPDTAEAKV